MEKPISVMLLGKDFFDTKEVKYFQLYTNRKYYEVGDFKLSIEESDYDSNMVFCWIPERDLIGFIQKTTISRVQTGTEVLLEGNFCESDLFDSIISTTYNGTNKTIFEIMEDMWNSFQQGTLIGRFYNESFSNKTYKMQETGTDLCTEFYKLLKINEASWQVRYEPGIEPPYDRLGLYVFKGNDVSDDVIFSESLGDIATYSIVTDDSNFKNVAIIQGQINTDGTRATADASVMNQLHTKARYLYVDARDLQQATGEATIDYIARLEQRGFEKLREHQEIIDVSVELKDNRYRYGIDFDLGDVITVRIESVGMDFAARIVQIEETVQNGVVERKLSIGNVKANK